MTINSWRGWGPCHKIVLAEYVGDNVDVMAKTIMATAVMTRTQMGEVRAGDLYG